MTLKNFLFVDFETYFDREYSLRKMSTPEYILHPQFAVQLLAVYDIKKDAPEIILPQNIPDFLAQYPAEETICVSHNALFDLAILGWRYGWVPGRLGDTLGMARALRTCKSYALGAVAKELFGFDSKGDLIHKVVGMSIQDIKNAGLWPDYRTYALNDVRICSQIYFRLASEFPEEEARVMDLVLRCAVQPVLHADVPLLRTHLNELRRKKQLLLNDCGYDKAALMSTAQFREALEGLGVDIKEKLSATNRMVPQFAKSDPFMEELLEYNESDNDDVNYQVQTLAAARLSFKSTIEETRAERFLNIAQLPWGNGPMLPVALRYGGAHTHRLSGEWKLNMQNLPRDKTKSKLRAALRAPPGHKLVTADLSQIEARLVAVLARQDALVEAFRRGEDVYASFASIVFGRNVNKISDPNERFIGKVGILSLGYGAGVNRFYQMVTSQARQYNIPLEGLFDMRTAEKTVNTYRSLFARIPAAWKTLDVHLQYRINGGNQTPALFGPVAISSGQIKLPNSMTLRYQQGDQSLYGAKLLENISQALARIVIMQAAVRLDKLGYRFVLQSHDELVFAVPETQVEIAKKIILDEMVRPPEWLPGLPLAAEVGVGDNYAGEVVAWKPVTRQPYEVSNMSDEVSNTSENTSPLVTRKEGALFYESKTIEWWTPRQYIDLAVAVMGGIDLDPASCTGANEIIKATTFYAVEGELKPWHGRVWLNPPYGRQTKLFVNQLLSEYQQGRVSEAIVLLNMITMDRGWFKPLWEFPICFHYGRVKFTSPDVILGKIKSISTPPTGSVFIYLGPNTPRFVDIFSSVGAVLKRIKL